MTAIAGDVYKPVLAEIVKINLEVGGPRPIRTFSLRIRDEEARRNFRWRPGQCAMVGVLGKGESFFAISAPPVEGRLPEVSVMNTGGKNTTALHMQEVGDTVTVRGPYGNGFPVEEWEGKDLFFAGAGIGMAPMRTVYEYCLAPENRLKYKDITIVYGARSTGDLAFMKELEVLEKRDDVSIFLCIDWKFGKDGMIDADAEEGWPKINMKSPKDTVIPPGQNRFTCFVPQLVEVVKPSPENAVALCCGPPIAIKFITQNLEALDWHPGNIYTTLENRMKCGIGKCGRCNVGPIYVCKDGPVFTYEQVKGMYADM